LLRVDCDMHKHSAGLLASILFAYTSLLVCGAAPSFAQGGAVSDKETPQFQSAVIPFSFEDNRIFVKTIINGKGPFSFVVDTGGDLTIDRAVARRIGLHSKPAGSLSGAGSSTASYSTAVVATVQVGTAQADNQEAEVLDLSQIREGIGLPRLDGIIGYSMLKHYAVEVDMVTHVLTLSRGQINLPGSARAVHLTIDSGFIFVPGRIQGDSGRILIDTGDRSSLTLFSPFAVRHHIYGRFGGVQNVLTGFGVGGPVYGDVFTLPKLDVMGAHFSNITTRASRQKRGVFASEVAAGSIGGGLLRRFNIVYDYPHSTIYVWRNELFAIPDSYDRAGLWISTRDDHAYIASVLPAGPAAKAGLQQGDEIVTVNGRRVGGQDILTLRKLFSSNPPGTSIRITRESRGKTSSHDIVLKQLV